MEIAVRGIVAGHVRVRTGERDLHSGVYGGVALNAAHVLTQMLAPVLPGPDGRLREELRAGLAAPGAEEIESWNELPAGADVLAAAGATEIAPGAAAELYARTWADTSLDVNGIESGDAVQRRTIIPHSASARVTRARLARPERRGDRDGAGAPPARGGARRAPRSSSTSTPPSPPASIRPIRSLVIAREAIGRAAGSKPLLVRTGGSIPILAALAQRGIPTVLSGFALDADGIHGPDESFRLESLALGERAARELYASLAALSSGVGGDRRLDALARDQLDAVGGRADHRRRVLVGLERREHPVGEVAAVARALAADAAAHAPEVARPEALGDRAQAVVAAQAAAELGAHLPELRLDVVVHADRPDPARGRTRARPSARARPRGS